MESIKNNTCCFTGHRPQNLLWGYAEKGLKFYLFKEKLKETIKNTINEGYIHFISGMALGVDMVSAELVLELKKQYNYITLECAIPCVDQPRKWSEESKKRYNNIISRADKITYVSKQQYFNGCMQNRNKYMINSSSLLIAIFNGSNGGTKCTIQFAKKNNLNIKFILI